jgi:LysR family transcriptional regulator, flagellar master operon regulator
MDLALIKTFLEVAATGSFVAASERLFVTQSAVSLRIARLEELLGQTLFTRSKTGADITASGREFESYARTLLRTWEQARQHIAIPAGFTRSLTLGGQVSLWPQLGFRWIDRINAECPDVGIRAELGMPETLIRSMTDGVMQICLTYSPGFRPGLSVEKIMEDELVMVAPWENPTLDQLAGRYVYVDWGPDFHSFHNQHHAALSNPGLTLAMGAASGHYIAARGAAAYLPARIVRHYMQDGRLFLVEGAPTFTHVAWSVWRDDLDEDLAEVARRTLVDVAAQAASETVDVTSLI